MKLILKFDKTELICFTILFFILETPFFTSVGSIDTIFDVCKIAISASVILYALSVRIRMNHVFLTLILYRIEILISTIMNQKPIKGTIYEFAYAIVLFILIEILLENKKIICFVNGVYALLMLYILLNLLSYFACYPDGLYRSSDVQRTACYFLGFKNEATHYIIAALGFSLMRSYIYRKKVFIELIELIIISLYTFLSGSDTGIITCFVAMIIYILSQYNNVFAKIKMLYVYIVGFFMSVLIVFVRIQSNFEEIFKKLFGKDITLSNRTLLWDQILVYISRKPIFGYGQLDDLRLMVGKYWANHAHNYFLQQLLIGGIVGIVLFCIMLLVVGRGFDKDKCTNLSFAFIIVMIAYMIEFITEGTTKPIFYAFIIMQYNIKEIEQQCMYKVNNELPQFI